MIYLITAPVSVNGKHWELDFSNGKATTDNDRLASLYRKRGYTVDVIKTGQVPENEPDEDKAPESEPCEQSNTDNDTATEETRDKPCRTSTKRNTKT